MRRHPEWWAGIRTSETVAENARRLGKSRNAVKLAARALGKTLRKQPRWWSYLREDETVAQNARRLKRAESVVRRAARRVGVTLATYTPSRPDWWSQIDPSLSVRENAAYLDRTPGSVSHAARKLGLRLPRYSSGLPDEYVLRVVSRWEPRLAHEIWERVLDDWGSVALRTVQRKLASLRKRGKVYQDYEFRYVRKV